MTSQILELYARCGRSLLKNGVCEAALPISEIENAMKLFSENEILVLGGDIYKETSLDNFKCTYDSWFYDGNSIEESISHAINYLRIFQGQKVFISFILK